jgi:tetratricopeptide (TPR) repeat protein
MRVMIYGISKDEADNVEQFMALAEQADGVYILDTGSTDNTPNLLRQHGAYVAVNDYGSNFRFDQARNDSLNLIPNDPDIVCLYLDLDERIDKDWRARLEQLYSPEIDEYQFYWYEDHGNAITFSNIRAHSRTTHTWQYPVHEVLVSKHQVRTAHTGIYVTHNPLPKQRNYLPLLELAYKENPRDTRVLHYLGREYMYLGQQNSGFYEQALRMFHLYLNRNHNLLWAPELSQVLNYCANCYKQLGQYWQAEQYYIKSIAAFPTTREPYLELARYYFDCQEFESCLGMIHTALRISKVPESYLYYNYNDWRSGPYLLASQVYLQLNLGDKAQQYFDHAFEHLSPTPELIASYYNAFGCLPEGLGLTIDKAMLNDQTDTEYTDS